MNPLADAVVSGRGDAAFHGALLLLCGGVLGLAAMMSIGNEDRVFLPGLAAPLPELCTLQRLWGLECPGCGLTRSFIALANGHWRAAWSYNPAGAWLFAIMAFQLPYRVVQLVRVSGGRREMSLGYVAHGALAAFAVGLIGQWALRICGVWF